MMWDLSCSWRSWLARGRDRPVGAGARLQVWMGWTSWELPGLGAGRQRERLSRGSGEGSWEVAMVGWASSWQERWRCVEAWGRRIPGHKLKEQQEVAVTWVREWESLFPVGKAVRMEVWGAVRADPQNSGRLIRTGEGVRQGSAQIAVPARARVSLRRGGKDQSRQTRTQRGPGGPPCWVRTQTQPASRGCILWSSTQSKTREWSHFTLLWQHLLRLPQPLVTSKELGEL